MRTVCPLLQPEGWDLQALWRSRREASEFADDGAEHRPHRRSERALAPLVGPSRDGAGGVSASSGRWGALCQAVRL